MNYFIHKNALVETNKIGKDTRIWAFVHILKEAQIGENNNICDQCFIENEVVMGNNVTVKCGVYLWDGITIEDNVQIGPAVAFTNDKYPRAKNVNYALKKTLLKKGSSIGANATILPGITIGEWAMVGAGAVVTKNVPNFAMVYGNPATIQGHVCVCGEILKFKKKLTECKCNRRYTLNDGVVKIND